METLTIALLSLLFTFILSFLPPLLDGIERKVRAKIQSRIGPPTLLQTWYDLLKLGVKELKIPLSGESAAFLVMFSLLVTLMSLYVVVYVVLTLTTSIDSMVLDMFLILVATSHSLGLVASVTTSNPFALIGSYRSMLLTVLNKLGLVVGSFISIYSGLKLVTHYSISTLIVYLSSLAILLIATYVSSGRLPFDIHEAEPELASGTLIEFSGKLLGFYIYTHLLMRYVLSFLVAIALVTPFITSLPILSVAFPISLLLSVCFYLAYGVVATLLGRTRVDIGVRTLFTYYLLVLIVLVIFTWIGI
ncbi:MAG: NADH-quinone oxidoreductase subunit H [Desulfurococcaceae archaeon TW002]